jgi:aminoglycoside N3'-acetyltransferase
MNLKITKKIYTEQDLDKIFEKFELKNKPNLFVASDLGKLGIIKNKNKISTLETIYNNLIKYNKNMNIIVPTATINIINTDIVYDQLKTKSHKMGSFSEYIRTMKGATRSFHPIWSLSGIGPNIKEYFYNISKHAYDNNSVFSRLYKNDFYFLSLGAHPRFTLSIVHHIEHINKVPYRFKKGFIINYFDSKGKVHKEEFFLDVLKEEYRYEKRLKNKKIFDFFEKNNTFYNFEIGKGNVSLFSYKDFFNSTNKLMNKDIYSWFK